MERIRVESILGTDNGEETLNETVEGEIGGAFGMRDEKAGKSGSLHPTNPSARRTEPRKSERTRNAIPVAPSFSGQTEGTAVFDSGEGHFGASLLHSRNASVLYAQ